MDVAVENTGPLERTMKIAIPAAEVDESIEQRLSNLSRTARINGFRPGKVPMRVIRSRYREQVEQEVSVELLQQRFFEALTEQALRPAGTPRIEPQRREPGEDLVFIASFEVFPKVALADLSQASVAIPKAGITQEDVDQVIESLRRQRTEWDPVERPAAADDKVTLDFRGTIDGEPFEGGASEGFEAVLGQSGLLEGFEESIKGRCAGERFSCEVSFPEDYGHSSLAGKTATFEIALHKVAAPRLPELDADFARAFGVEDGAIEALRAKVRENMQRELDIRLRALTKERVVEVLRERHPLDLPAAAVDEECHRLAHDRKREGQDAHDPALLEALRPQAERRVALGLIMAEIASSQELKADPAKVRGEIERLAAPFDEKEAVISWYYTQPERLQEIENMVLENEVIDWALQRMQITEEPMSFDEAMGRG